MLVRQKYVRQYYEYGWGTGLGNEGKTAFGVLVFVNKKLSWNIVQ